MPQQPKIGEDVTDLMPVGADVTDLMEPKAPPPDDTPSVMESTPSRVLRTVGDALPTIGGMAGGLAGVPAGPLGSIGLATMGGAAGEFGRQTLNTLRGKGPESVTASVTDAATEGLKQGVAEGVGAGAARALSAGGKAVYRGYLKPSLSERLLPKAERTVETAIREGLPISERGQATGRELINDLKTRVDRLLTNSNRTVDLKQVANVVRAHARSKYYRPGVDLTDFNAAMAVADKLDKHPSLGIPPGANPTAVRVRLDRANEIKRALDHAITETQFGVTSGAKTATEKVARHEINKAMRAQMPEIGPLNTRESQLIDAVKAIGKAVGREANTNQLTGWRSLVSGGAAATGATLGGQDPTTAAALGILLRGGLQPAVASRVALTAARSSQQLGLGLTEAIRLSMFALQNTDEP